MNINVRRGVLRQSPGSALAMTLGFMLLFGILFLALVGLVTRSYHEATVQIKDEGAFQIAEAGLNYGRWRLSHNNNNLSPETRTISDQYAGILGSYTVTFERPTNNSIILLTSRGYTSARPDRAVTLTARFGQPSLARYSAIYNDDYWFGNGEIISGPVHANGGIRMDGASDSVMSSAKSTYVCQSRSGCNNETKPGIWGTGTRSELWRFPVAPVDFNALTLDLLHIKDQAVATNTYYGSSHQYGYHIVFGTDGKYSIYQVDALTPKLNAWSLNGGWKRVSYDISRETWLATRDVPVNGVIYAEDNVWLDGHIRGRVTVAAGVFPDAPGTNADIILNGTLTYDGVRDGSRALGVVAQRNIIIPYAAAPQNMALDGAFIAQKGSFGRHYYDVNDPDTSANAIKNSISIFGMVAFDNLAIDVTWGNGTGVTSGYRTVQRNYDVNFLYNPPPFFPASGGLEILSWQKE